ncbi:MAG TPA: 16S rRNA (uracil(1498)-N(3))-methyltransferase [Pyrinomonadaceae bacterium]|jgi:16S rRNA (uracil1498-N3)-methyltransferase
MTRRRFYAPAETFDASATGATVRLAPEESRHLRDVLRLRAGDEAYVFDGEGGEYLCVVVESGGGGGGRGSGGGATLEVRERVEPLRPESPLDLSLAVALLKGEKFDLVVQKATELGATSIVPVVTRRADVRLRDERDEGKRTARWQRLALEAAKQSGRARVPVVHAPSSFASVLTGADGRGVATLRLMFVERDGRSLVETVGDLAGARPASVAALVGPEGGWETEETSEATEAGWKVVTLGGRTLRAETAAITVAALLQHLFGDLR